SAQRRGVREPREGLDPLPRKAGGGSFRRRSWTRHEPQIVNPQTWRAERLQPAQIGSEAIETPVESLGDGLDVLELETHWWNHPQDVAIRARLADDETVLPRLLE